MSKFTAPIRRDIGELGSEMKIFEWRIPDFFTGFEDSKKYMYVSPTFSITNTIWDLRLLINCSRNDAFIEIAIMADEEATREYSLKYFFGLKRKDGSVEEICSGILEGNESWSSWQPFIKQSELLQQKTVLAPSNIVTVTCILRGCTEIPPFPEPTPSDETKQLKLTRLDKLSANFKELYADKQTCDVTLKVQDQEFKAHSQVLMARSSVFAATFKHDTLEKQSGVITIPDCDPDSFQEFLEYLYSGELVELSLNSAFSLYYTSDKYDVEEVKEFCVDYLNRSLSIENVCDVAEFADKYDEAQLFSQVQDFFNKDSSKVLLTSGWECLIKKDCRLANKLLTGMAKKNLEA